ncbi:MAG: hypothetical protein HQM14_11075 [SAR324 cluster bacterium]|nr:hypothetical protein [SAR324 cluster bacterium]
MVHGKKTLKNAEESLKDPLVFNDTLEQIEKGSSFLILLPEDLYQSYQTVLQKRCSSLGYKVTIAKEGAGNTEKFDHVLSFHGPNFYNAIKEISFKKFPKQKLFQVEGSPDLNKLEPILRENQALTHSEKRFIKLKEEALVLERNRVFLKLAYHHEVIQYKSKRLKEKQDELKQLDRKIARIDQVYYQALSFIIIEAVGKVTGVGDSVEDVMKALVKVLIVDDLKDMTVKGLIPLGFVRKNLSTMSTYQLQHKYNVFLAANIKDHPLEHLTIKDFLINAPELEGYDIVIINFWNFKEDKLPIHVRIKKKTILSKKEQKQLKQNPEMLAQEIQKLKDQRMNLHKQLKRAEKKLNETEQSGKIAEDKYQAFVKQRKRIVKNLKKNREQLQKKQGTRIKKAKFNFYTKGLIETVREHQSIADRIGETISQWRQVGDLLKAFIDTDSNLNIPELKKMLDIAEFRHHVDMSAEQLEEEIDLLKLKVENYAKKNELWNNNTGYQQFLDDHVLDKLELALLGSSIADVKEVLHRYPGNYFQAQGIDARAEWSPALLDNIHIYVATKMGYVVSVDMLRNFFQIKKREVPQRIKIAPTLPTETDFSNQAFDLLIINRDAFDLPDIFTCLRTRNQSINSHIPVLLLDAGKQETSMEDRLLLHLMIGLPANSNDETTYNVPHYQIKSLSDQKPLFSTLAEVMGIPLHSIYAMIN